jgi:hypothetical protein
MCLSIAVQTDKTWEFLLKSSEKRCMAHLREASDPESCS